MNDADLGKITQWLQQQGLQVVSVARGRNWIAVSGTAAQVEAAFQTEIHNYLVDGETHYANASEPSVPAAFGSVVKGIRGLNDFRMKPRLRAPRMPSPTPPGRITRPAQARLTMVAPDDFATIYDVAPLYAAGINGTGQKIAIAGQIEVNLSDIEQFRSQFNLPANDPQTLLVPGSRNPGTARTSGDLAESDLDLEWSGAVARNATIIFVYSTDVMTSVQYAIDQKLAPVVSVSYGSCEPETPAFGVHRVPPMGAASQRARHDMVRRLGRQRRGGLQRFAKSGAGRGPSRQRAGSDQRGRHGVRRRAPVLIGASHEQRQRRIGAVLHSGD